MKFAIFYFLIPFNFIYIYSFDKKIDLKFNKSKNNNENIETIKVLSISYELRYNNSLYIKVIINSCNNIINKLQFKAFLKSDDELNEFSLNCNNKGSNLIICLTTDNPILDKKKKYYFYYNKNRSSSSLAFNDQDIFSDNNRISLIFHPDIIENQVLYKDKKQFEVKITNDIVSNGKLFVLRKSKKILKERYDKFNKYIDLNNFIFRGGLLTFTLKAYEEAIRRGYKMVDADIIFTKDDIPVIFHGDNLKNISNGEGKLIDKTLEELEQLDFGSKVNKIYCGEKILKFEDLLKLCKKNNIIIDLDLNHLNYPKFYNDMKKYAKLIIDYIEKYDMINSIIFNDRRKFIIETFKSIKNDLSFSINGMNERVNIEKIKDKYQDSKVLIYNMGDLQKGKKINKDAVKYGLSLGKKIKAAKIDDINLANKVVSWGVNFICTNKLESFLMKNDKEEPIIVNCEKTKNYTNISICTIDNNNKLIDNEIYNIYYYI